MRRGPLFSELAIRNYIESIRIFGIDAIEKDLAQLYEVEGMTLEKTVREQLAEDITKNLLQAAEWCDIEGVMELMNLAHKFVEESEKGLSRLDKMEKYEKIIFGKDENGCNALHFALSMTGLSSHDRYELVEFLLNKGFNPFLQSNVGSPFFIAAQLGQLDILQLFSKHYELNAENINEMSSIIHRENPFPTSRDTKENEINLAVTPLDIAKINGHKEVAQFLEKHGAKRALEADRDLLSYFMRDAVSQTVEESPKDKATRLEVKHGVPEATASEGILDSKRAEHDKPQFIYLLREAGELSEKHEITSDFVQKARAYYDSKQVEPHIEEPLFSLLTLIKNPELGSLGYDLFREIQAYVDGWQAEPDKQAEESDVREAKTVAQTETESQKNKVAPLELKEDELDRDPFSLPLSPITPTTPSPDDQLPLSVERQLSADFDLSSPIPRGPRTSPAFFRQRSDSGNSISWDMDSPSNTVPGLGNG